MGTTLEEEKGEVKILVWMWKEEEAEEREERVSDEEGNESEGMKKE